MSVCCTRDFGRALIYDSVYVISPLMLFLLYMCDTFYYVKKNLSSKAVHMISSKFFSP